MAVFLEGELKDLENWQRIKEHANQEMNKAELEKFDVAIRTEQQGKGMMIDKFSPGSRLVEFVFKYENHEELKEIIDIESFVKEEIMDPLWELLVDWGRQILKDHGLLEDV